MKFDYDYYIFFKECHIWWLLQKVSSDVVFKINAFTLFGGNEGTLFEEVVVQWKWSLFFFFLGVKKVQGYCLKQMDKYRFFFFFFIIHSSWLLLMVTPTSAFVVVVVPAFFIICRFIVSVCLVHHVVDSLSFPPTGVHDASPFSRGRRLASTLSVLRCPLASAF